ncbi:MAG: ATP-dependent DNA helicase RecQ [Planctomycetota bacterium]|jgi:ATP-dependent DNA helicase RecQ
MTSMPNSLLKARDPEVLAALRDRFGWDDYQGLQEAAIDGVLAGRDGLLTLPTGAGKSLVYQLPAVVLPGLTLVVSPLIALMQDQVQALKAKGIRAEFVNSTLSRAVRLQRLDAACAGKLDLLYVTPERFRSVDFKEREGRLHLSLLAIDEAHCVSQWGHDFRPDYSRLAGVRERLGNPPTVALTATATPQVAEDIVTSLALKDPWVLRAGIERSNLFLASHPVFTSDEKLDHLVRRIQSLSGPGIVYSALIKDLEALHVELRRRGIKSLVYHGRLSVEERRAMQEEFMASEDALVLATNAFGMGIDKANIRFVLHAQIPRTLEAWTQEVGRAGRDGKPSFCEVVYLQEDLAIQQNFINWANPSLEYVVGVYEVLRGWGERLQARDLDDLRAELLVKERRDGRIGIVMRWFEVLGVTYGSFEEHNLRLNRELDLDELPAFLGSGEKRQSDLKGLLTMVRFAGESEDCRRRSLAQHFSLAEPEVPCPGCDVCGDPDVYLAGHHSPRREAPASSESDAAPEASKGFARGEWVEVGRHLGQVVRVDGSGSRQVLWVESASDLKRRRVDPKKQQVKKIVT